jgi:TolA-binding protein
MERTRKRKTLTALILLNILLVYPSSLISAKPPEISVPHGSGLGRHVLITTTDSEYGTTVEILGPVKVPEFRTMAFESPPMIAVDIFRRVPSFESVTIPLKSPNLKDIRLGYHPEKIRVVLDIRGSHIPPFSTESVNNRLSLFLRSKELAVRSSPADKGPKAKKTRIQSESDKAKQPLVSSSVDIPSVEKLMQIEGDDGQEDTALFLEGIHAYREEEWSSAVDGIQRLLTMYPTGRYAERAHFLIAKAYEQLYSDSILTHFSEITKNYTEAIRKFPQSIHAAEALLSIGDLYYRIENSHEASGYYKLVLKKEKDSILALRATIGIARIMALRENRKEAVTFLKRMIGKHPDSPENSEAMIEMAKILYEMRYFLKSLEIFSSLKKMDPENKYRYPEISLFLGHNYYQLGENRKARENFLRYYNICLEKEPSHLILTKIGDTYRDEGAPKEAAEFYNLVITLHPEKEGAVISRIRLAELKEDGRLEADDALAFATNILGKEQGSAREIYEKILSQPFEQDQKKSLEQLTMFKLAILEQNKEDYDESLKTLRILLRRFPNTSLKKDSKSALRKSIQAILDKELKEERFEKIIRVYERERDLFSMVHDPDLFLYVARASIRLNLDDMAKEMFKKADSFWPNKKKPPDMLLFTAEDLFEREELKPAMAKMDLLLKDYPSDPNVPNAYQLKGRILFKQKNMEKAVEMFSSAARFHVDPCKRAGILVDKGKALAGGGLRKKALIAIGEANRLIGDCNSSDTRLGREAGELLLSLGHPKEALSILNQALEVEKNKENIILIQLEIAECFWLLNKKADSFALYEKLAALDDPFWSNLAKERREDLNFKMEMEINK